MGFLAEIAESEEDQSTAEPQSDFFLLLFLGVFSGAKSNADLLIQMKLMDDQDFVKLMTVVVEQDARFYALSQADRDKVIERILAGSDCMTAIESIDLAPLSPKAIERIEAFEELCDARLADHVPLPHDALSVSASETRH